MSEPAALIHVEVEGRTRLVGQLWSARSRGREVFAFEYAVNWLSDGFALEPGLSLGPGAFHSAKGLFASLSDAAPDRWGRTLLARAERSASASEARTPRTLGEVDYLLGASDVSRQGALRLTRRPGGAFEATGGRVPPMVSLGRLLAASDRVQADEESAEDLLLLVAPGSSLGGARPKASISDRGALWVAKFPSRDDDRDTVRWEGVALELARSCGLAVPDTRVVEVAGRPVFLSRRFDRAGSRRLPFLSALTLLGASDGETHSYTEIADAVRQHGSRPGPDLAELWRRLAFNILVTNTDDHLRNHGFLGDGRLGWRLSPAYDLNPVPVQVRPRVLSTSPGDDGDGTASLARALELAPRFGLSVSDARSAARSMAAVTSRWREVAAAAGLGGREIDRHSSAFEHEDLVEALR